MLMLKVPCIIPQQEAAFWEMFNERCPHEGVLYDEIDTNCGTVNSVSIYLT